MSLKLFSDGQEIVFEDFNDLQKALQGLMYDRIVFELLQRVENAFFQDSFTVNFASATSLTVVSGLGFQTDSSKTAPDFQKRPLYLGSNETINLPAADGSNDRIDLIVVSSQIVDRVTESRKFKDAISGDITDEDFVVLQDYEALIEVVQGTPAASPVAPAVPSGKIKIAEVLVSAVSGVADQNAITDTRSQLPVGGDLALSTLGFSRLTAGASVPLSQLIQEIDTLLTAGRQDYIDIVQNDTPDAEVGNPAVGQQRLFYRDGVAFFKDSAGIKVPVGSGGGGGGGLVWTSPDGEAPVLEEEFGSDIFKFQRGLDQKVVVYLKVPESFLAGRQISMVIGQYSPNDQDTQLLRASVGLIRVNNDPIDTPASSRVSTNTAITNTVANQYRKVTLDLTTATGQVDGFNVSPGDLLKVEISRGTDDDTEDVRFIPSSTEVQFG